MTVLTSKETLRLYDLCQHTHFDKEKTWDEFSELMEKYRSDQINRRSYKTLLKLYSILSRKELIEMTFEQQLTYLYLFHEDTEK